MALYDFVRDCLFFWWRTCLRRVVGVALGIVVGLGVILIGFAAPWVAVGLGNELLMVAGAVAHVIVGVVRVLAGR